MATIEFSSLGITRMMKLLTRRGVLVEEQGQTYLAVNEGDSDEARVLRPLEAAACMPQFAARPTTAKRWKNCAVTSPARRWPTNTGKPTLLGQAC